LISETPFGERATRWRFPARNRLIAGLSELVVVVESHIAGGALHTVDEAMRRNIDVVAVPGSVLSQSCGGTNQLLMEGLPPVRGGQDLVDLLGLVSDGSNQHQQLTLKPAPTETRHDGAPARDGSPEDSRDAAILTALESGPAGMDALASATGIEVGALLSIVQRLKRAERVKIDGSLIVKAMPGEE
jgi:DNA processing protein